MNNPSDFQHFRFDRRPRLIPGKVLPMGIAVIAFSLAWFLIPHPALYWTMLLAILILVWVAGFGWRQALSNLINWLQRFEQL
jgi:hypothetical protein